MQIRCPHCDHPMALKGARAGNFHPRCPQCGEKFRLIVPAEGKGSPQALKISLHDPSETLNPTISVALGIEVPAGARQPQTPAPSRATQTVAPGASPVNAPERKTASGRTAGGDVKTSPPPSKGPDGSAGGSGTATTGPPSATQATVAIAPEASAPGADDGVEITGRLGGYELLRKLGQGGMGAVFLARQLSLDRNVALKVLLSHFADDPQFVSRFIREAYAAAQLTHHNVVQIHDIGVQNRSHFFSMEFVEGRTLAELLRESGPMDAETAVGYILQAARGLQFAHEHGLVHRDVKPENLLLNRHGMLKVADLGLVKTAEQAQPVAGSTAPTVADKLYDDEATQLNISMGTPAYMPPEQARDAHSVDIRADVYALGGTLYTLLVGHPPFQGGSALEVITKHIREPVTPPDQIVQGVPEYLSKIILRMLAKRPDDRYQDMSQVILALEEFAGVETTGPFKPTEDQIRSLAGCVQKFNASPWAKFKRLMALVFFPVCGVLFLMSMLLPVGPVVTFRLAVGIISFAAMTPLAYVIFSGLTERSYLVARVREFFVDGGIISLFCWLGGAALFACVLYVLDIHMAWLISLIAATIAGYAFHAMVDSAIAEDRLDPLARTGALLQPIRRLGVSEAAIQQFVCKNAGEHWEEFYEGLFGYESKMMARREWGRLDAADRPNAGPNTGDRGQPRPRFAAWRDGIIEWIDARQRARREARDRHYLALVEREYLKAQGFPDALAEKKARQTAMSLVVRGAELRQAAMERVMQVTLTPPAQEREQGKEQSEGDGDKPRFKKKSLRYDEGLEGYEHQSYFQRRYGGKAGFFLAPPVRFVLGAILIAGCLTWANQNNLMPTSMQQTSLDNATPFGETRNVVVTQPLKLGFLPDAIAGWLGGWQAGVAGLLLVISVFMGSPKIGLYMIPAALVILIGTKVAPDIAFVKAWVFASIAGILVAFGGYRATRE